MGKNDIAIRTNVHHAEGVATREKVAGSSSDADVLSPFLRGRIGIGKNPAICDIRRGISDSLVTAASND